MTIGVISPLHAGTHNNLSFPTTAELLVQGGDTRISLDSQSGTNKYGFQPKPDNELLAFGSSTASVISEAGFAAADTLRNRLMLATHLQPHTNVYTNELNRVRSELIELCGLSGLDGLECVFAASGTDIHLLAAQLIASAKKKLPLVVMVEAVETGSGVPVALSGRHFNSRSALGSDEIEGELLTSSAAVEVTTVSVRSLNGNVRHTAEVDAEVQAKVLGAAAKGRPVIVILTDVSKTGLIAPSLACIVGLQQQVAEGIEVLVDACQFRLAPATLHAYIKQGFMVALTGSKFISGPPFCGALLIPSESARSLRWHTLPRSLMAYSSRADWPSSWASADELDDVANLGLLLRWEAALEELRQFRAVPEAYIIDFLEHFASAVQKRLANDPNFEPLPVLQLDRKPLFAGKSWDQVQTIFPFLLYRADDFRKTALTVKETEEVYRLLQIDSSELGVDSGGSELLRPRYQLGRPVACGLRDGVFVSALRLCVSTRLVVESIKNQGQAKQLIDNALAALDKAAKLISSTQNSE